MYRGNGSRVAAVIVIDSNVVKMKISQIYRSKINDLETLEYPISVGHEVFSTGKISFDSVREISSILNGYLKLFDEYKVVNYRVVGTTAIREAENREFVVDQLKVQNGLNVEILESNQEEALIYSRVIEKMENEGDDKELNTIIANISTGSLGIALYKDCLIKFSHNIPIGYMKFYDMFSKIVDGGNDISTVLEEYMSVLMRGMEYWIDSKSGTVLFLTGNDIGLIAELLHILYSNDKYEVRIGELKKLYDMFSDINIQKLSLKFNISTERVKLVCSILSICTGILEAANVNKLVFVKAELIDCIIKSLLKKKDMLAVEENIKNSTLESARSIAKYYRSNKKHCNIVCNNACAVFDRLKKIHGLSQRKRLLLQVACIMHECGKCINLKTPNENVFNTIKSTNIYGLSLEENLIVACIAGYNNGSLRKYESEVRKKLTVKSKLVVSKLTAIFIMADALDISNKQKLSQIKVKLSQGEVIVVGKTDKNVLFEQWEFKRCSDLFKNVFGMKINLLIKPKNLSI